MSPLSRTSTPSSSSAPVLMSPDGRRSSSSTSSTAAWLLSKVRGSSGPIAEMRSGVVEESSDPEWQHTLLLDNLAAATAKGATGVLIKVYDSVQGVDSSSCSLTEMIGHVTIPVDCFLPEVEAVLTLPLEAPPQGSQQGSEVRHWGEISFTTKLLAVQGCNSNGHSNGNSESLATPMAVSGPPSSMLSPSSSSSSSSSSAPTTLRLVFQLRPTSAMGVWWPCRLMEGGQSKGDVYCSPEALLVRFAPCEGGMLACSKDSSRFTVLTNPPSVSRNSNNNSNNSQWTLVSVPWEKVRCVVELTASVLLVTVAFKQVTLHRDPYM